VGKGILGIAILCALPASLLAAGAAQAQHYGRDDHGSGVVRCESIKNRSNECRVDGRARLIRQLSGSPCIEGRTWGQSRGGVWVTQGCRAEFVGESRGGRGHGGGWGGNGGQMIACHSNDRRQKYCDARIRRDVRLVRQDSRSPCVEGRTWGWDRRGVWVSDGCRAQFQIN